MFCGWTKEFEKRFFGSFVRVNLCELSFQVLSACPVKTPTLLDQENSIKQSIQFQFTHMYTILNTWAWGKHGPSSSGPQKSTQKVFSNSLVQPQNNGSPPVHSAAAKVQSFLAQLGCRLLVPCGPVPRSSCIVGLGLPFFPNSIPLKHS